MKITNIKTKFSCDDTEGKIILQMEDEQVIELSIYDAQCIGKCARAFNEYGYLCDYFKEEKPEFEKAAYRIVNRLDDNDGLTTEICTIENDIIKNMQEEGEL